MFRYLSFLFKTRNYTELYVSIRIGHAVAAVLLRNPAISSGRHPAINWNTFFRDTAFAHAAELLQAGGVGSLQTPLPTPPACSKADLQHTEIVVTSREKPPTFPGCSKQDLLHMGQVGSSRNRAGCRQPAGQGRALYQKHRSWSGAHAALQPERHSGSRAQQR